MFCSRTKGRMLFLIAIIFISVDVYAKRKHLGFGFENEKETVNIPFKSVKTLIILEAEIDGKSKLNLILDTGIRSLVLFKKSFLPKISELTFDL